MRPSKSPGCCCVQIRIRVVFVVVVYVVSVVIVHGEFVSHVIQQGHHRCVSHIETLPFGVQIDADAGFAEQSFHRH